MTPELERALAPQEWLDLPEFVKAQLSPREWMWLSDAEKARLIQTETEPETYDC